MNNEKPYDWIFLYWMPYDNNLSIFGNTILRMLARGIQSNNILVVVQADFSGAKQLSRHIFTQDNIDIHKLDTADSASEKVFAEYLNWAKSEFKGKKWAIVFLGHGGNLDEVSPDENPEHSLNLKTKWMNIHKLSLVIEKFNQEIDNRLELLFFQNCCKGTIEAHYTVRNTAKYTLSSQLQLGAPNYYYESTLEFLAWHPEVNGGQLATKIIECERSDMYHSYTVTGNRAFSLLPAKINFLIDAILASNIENININQVNIYYYMQDRMVDILDFLATIAQQSGVAKDKINDFTNFFKHTIIYHFQNDGTLLLTDKKYQQFSGLGMLLPNDRQHLEKYSYLSVFSDLKLSGLFQA
ncbi:MAG: clostripain-related cysteine peptidase, partial [Nostocaceae cyanobacterium]|nr:clostripain-related cysteine peptidase [Nostocaceae cyanobacterium]